MQVLRLQLLQEKFISALAGNVFSAMFAILLPHEVTKNAFFANIYI